MMDCTRCGEDGGVQPGRCWACTTAEEALTYQVDRAVVMAEHAEQRMFEAREEAARWRRRIAELAKADPQHFPKPAPPAPRHGA